MDPEFLSPFVRNLPLIVSFFGMLTGFSVIYLYDYISERFTIVFDNIIFSA